MLNFTETKNSTGYEFNVFTFGNCWEICSFDGTLVYENYIFDFYQWLVKSEWIFFLWLKNCWIYNQVICMITFTGVSPDILHEAAVDLINNTLCQAMWNTGVVVQDSVVCVDNREPYTPVCYVSYIHFVHELLNHWWLVQLRWSNVSQSTTTSVLVFAVILQAVYFDELLKCCAVVQVVEEVEIYVCKCYKGFKHF